ncbi:hypothetical protein BDN72DRAFT_788648 [Pluteus cervinus]|uniref:Uncharacterized protein n=1 Tax=Pluteus cervinus TaxID=181527 RepID=A0ACD3BB78_9AGAR|nr:hypothetical protein BDN72DRAFT_788648 [Pluteus cervinus]
MDRRRGIPNRPASSEEVDTWAHASKSLTALSNKLANASTADTINRVNKLILAWPTDDAVPADGIDGIKTLYRKLTTSIGDLRSATDEEKAIDEAIEKVGLVIALRKAPELPSSEKRKQRPRAPSPGGTAAVPSPAVGTRGVSITVPPRNSAGPGRDPKARKDALMKQLPLQEGRKVAFHPPPAKSGGNADQDENTWMLAIVTRCLSAEKNRYEVQDAEPQEDGQPGAHYNTNLKSIIPLPDPNALAGSASHVSAYQEFPTGSTVMALYPDTSCFYRAEVVATPREMQPTGRSVPSSKHMPTYKLKFEDDDNQEHTVAAQWVVEWPGT